jgi:hypothetical protein
MNEIEPAAWVSFIFAVVALVIMAIDQVRWKRSIRVWRREAKEQHQTALAQIANARRELPRS